MRTPVILVAGQDHTDEVTGALLRRTGTVVVEHRFDGHVVRRMTATLSRGELITTEDALEFAHGCVSCTIRDDLLVLLRRLHRRADVLFVHPAVEDAYPHEPPVAVGARGGGRRRIPFVIGKAR